MNFTVYSKPKCVYCDRAKTLLTASGLDYSEIIIDIGQDKDPLKTYVSVTELKAKVPGASSVPQIFAGDTHVGGFDSLVKYLAVLPVAA